ncbi:hypothetical protein H1230_13285 [Paenibacillus sp. 19GGS1-52]|uniref:hypothetical protein n=1 Tax=Paenibacillus sp. 19GGS1-52 TaxID=2758563 RepID=UPI001EFAC35E|nr:hypothetical protein [Paenibacillus sp. 19GGS1-52]ULO09654.1 hypothetical protein H1230_13285 [Paenibacillus sp. 19GGS1-52]
MNKNIVYATLFVIVFVLLKFILGEESNIPMFAVLVAIIFYGKAFIDGNREAKEFKRKQKIEYEMQVMTKELSKLETLRSNNIISEEEFDIKREQLKHKYKVSTENYIGS